MKATQEQRGRDNFMTPGCKGLYDANQSNGGSSAWGCRPETWSRDATRPRPVRPRSQGKGWEKGLSPELCGPGFQGGSGRPCRNQLWSPAADPLLTCTKPTKFMDNCQGLLRSPFPLFTNTASAASSRISFSAGKLTETWSSAIVPLSTK